MIICCEHVLFIQGKQVSINIYINKVKVNGRTQKKYLTKMNLFMIKKKFNKLQINEMFLTMVERIYRMCTVNINFNEEWIYSCKEGKY
jgi:hypothetical protein